MSSWECEFGRFHLFDWAEFSLEAETGIVTFHCANCQKEIAKKPLKGCPKDVQREVFELVTGDWEEVAWQDV